jgi:hypothetical protein
MAINGTEVYESDAEDCQLDGDEDAPITHKEYNRFMRRVMVGHYRPMRNKINTIVDWIEKADETSNQLHGALKMLKALGFIIVAVIVATFATTVWMISKLGLN